MTRAREFWFFSYPPTKEDLETALGIRAKTRMSDKEFDRAWWASVESARQRMMERRMIKLRPKLAEILMEHGNEEQKAVARKYFDDGIAHWEKRYWVKEA
jgi:hypothetical protein